LWPALAVPLFAMALCIAASRIQWIDAALVREAAPAQ
jgi:hypothetical protein